MSKRPREEGTTVFDFESYVQDTVLFKEDNSHKNDGKYRVIVCSFWLQGRCISGEDECTYLHKFDKSKMIQCKHGKLCKIKNCPLKHMDDGAMQECLYFRQGFCTKGPDCKMKHVKKRPEDRPVEANYDACAGGVIMPGAALSAQMQAKIKRSNAQNENFKSTICTHWLRNGSCHFNDDVRVCVCVCLYVSPSLCVSLRLSHPC